MGFDWWSSEAGGLQLGRKEGQVGTYGMESSSSTISISLAISSRSSFSFCGGEGKEGEMVSEEVDVA